MASSDTQKVSAIPIIQAPGLLFLNIALQLELPDLRPHRLHIHRSSSLCFGPSKASAARSRSDFFHSVIWCGCTSNCSANSETVFSPRIDAYATLALNSAP